ncbi:MAG: hypothetical protein IJS28_05425 [Synergistaceae bacterium]|nr:hypothetical protein [Synergistaceae bacterium]
MPHVIIYTDGGASPNPGLGGWAAILYSPEHSKKKALETLKVPCDIDLQIGSSAHNQRVSFRRYLHISDGHNRGVITCLT